MAQDRRFTPQIISEVRALTSDEGEDRIVGKGIVFNQRSQKLGYFIEIIDPSAVRNADFRDMKCYFNHNPDYTLASLANRTVDVTITEGSMDYDIQIPTTQTIRDLVYAPIKRGDITGSSFMFDVAKNGDEWEERDGVYIRTIHDIPFIYEMGPVSMPAYKSTSTDIAKRSFDSFIALTKTVELEASFHSRRITAERRLRIYQ